MTYNLTLDEAYSTMTESKNTMDKAKSIFEKTHSKTAATRLEKARVVFEVALKSYKDLENQIHNLRPNTFSRDEAWQGRIATWETMSQEEKDHARYEDYHTAMEFDAKAYWCTCREEWEKASYFLGIASWARMAWGAMGGTRRGAEARNALCKEEQRRRLDHLAVAYSRAERAWLQGKTELAAEILSGAESLRNKFSIYPRDNWIQVKELIEDAMAKKAHCEASTGMF